MADVKWIKIVTDIFDNRKIKLIRKMPEGAEIVVTWFQLLCLAGETNDNGLIYITRAIPYTEESLSNAFDTPLAVVRLALETFQGLEMITVVDSFLCISNWEKYQNVDGLTRIREQTKKRVASYREKQKQLAQCNVTVTLPVTQCNATEEDIEIDKEKESVDKLRKSDSFDAFWKAYPRKVGKEAARKAFAKVKVGLPVLLSAVEAQKKGEQWTKNNGQFIPNPATWLNQGRWEDETEPSGFVYNDYYEEGESL